MRLYHGSSEVVEKPGLELGKSNNDYGVGFYTTEDRSMANEWACKNANPPGFCNVYELDERGLTVLDLMSEKYTILNWIAILLKNRTFEIDQDIALEARDYLISHFIPDTVGVDVIVGYRADDSYFNYANAFVQNTLPLRRLAQALKLGKLGLQTALVSGKAFSRLKFKGAEEVDWTLYHRRYVERDNEARAEWRSAVKTSIAASDDIFVLDIIRGGLDNGDARIRELLLG